jgi:death-on-curing protein
MLTKAAHLCYGLANNHPFVDGNKRAAVHTMLAYLMLNDVTINYQQEDLYDMGMAVAMGKMTCEDIEIWLRERIES